MKAQITTDTWLEYDDAGQGPIVVLLHGFPFSKAMWRPQALALRANHRVIIPDLRGFGGSSLFGEMPSLARMADDVAGLLAALNIQEPVVVGGLSMGGYLALALVRQYPALPRALILADTRAEPDDAQAKANRDAMIEFARGHRAVDVIDRMMPKLLSEKTRRERPDVELTVRGIASDQSIEGIIGALQVLRDRPDARPALAAIRVPTLVLVGSDDALTPPATAQSLAAGIADAKLVEIPGAGHMSNLEEPTAFNAALAVFLQSLS